MAEISGPTLTKIATGLRFPEGPIAMPDGSVLLVEIARGTLSRVGSDGGVDVVAELGGGPNGAAIGPDGRCYVCNNGGFAVTEHKGRLYPGDSGDEYSGGRIERVDLETGTSEVLYDECDWHPLWGPNDIVFDASGGFYFTDHGKTRARDRDRTGVYYAAADGSAMSEVLFPMEGPNGIGLSPREDELYVAETPTGASGHTTSRPRERSDASVATSPTVVACCPASRATTCTTPWPSTGGATSAWRRSCRVGSRLSLHRANPRGTYRCRTG